MAQINGFAKFEPPLCRVWSGVNGCDWRRRSLHEPSCSIYICSAARRARHGSMQQSLALEKLPRRSKALSSLTL